MKAKEVTIGTKLWRHGHQWEVTKVTYDARGNDGHTPRYVFGARLVNGGELPAGYRDMELGYLPDAPVTI